MATLAARPGTQGLAHEPQFSGDAPLLATTRGGHVETVHRGTLTVCRASGAIEMAIGDPTQKTFVRSSAKPFQALALITTGTADALGLDDQDLAIAASSHSGEPEHVKAVQRLLQRAGITPDLLRCGAHAPNNARAAAELIASGEDPTVLHNNCSGKHAGMLAVCKHMGWPLATYLDSCHPLQVLNRDTIAAFTGCEAADIDVAVDGCGVPTFYVPVSGLATAFARLATGACLSDAEAGAAARIRAAMMAHPFLVGGTRRFDTDLMAAAHGTIVCKGGAQGCEGVGLAGASVGVGMKVTDGSSSPIGAVILRILRAFDALSHDAWLGVQQYETVTLRNHAGTVVGSAEPVFTVDAAA